MVGLRNTSGWIISRLETAFLRWGRFVADHPYPVILSSLLLTSLSSLGFLMFRMEAQANLLWIPADSVYNVNQDWLDDNFQKSTRVEVVIVQSENVLTPGVLQKMLEIYNAVGEIEKDGKQFSDICTKIPIADIFQTKRRRKRQASNTTEYYDDEDFWYDEYSEYRDEEEEEVVEDTPTRINFHKYGQEGEKKKEEDLSVLDTVPDQIYCDLVTTLSQKCLVRNLLEIWRFDESLIASTTQQEIIDSVNLLTASPWTGSSVSFPSLLGGVTRNSTGHIIAAGAARLVWAVEVDTESLVISSQGSGVELELADPTTLAWEGELVEVVRNISTPDVTVMVNAARSFGDISMEAIFFDVTLMAIGYLLMFIYTGLMLGRVNRLEVRVWLTVSGLLSIAMGLVVGLGLSSLMSYPYTPMHAILPFLCLGIGIDDMFVIVTCWSNLRRQPTFPGLSLADKLGLTLQHAGVSVTVTSLTDVFAFGVGAVTRMPGLESFCVCTAIAIGSIYLLQITWFVAWMSLDESRISSSRDSCCPCIKLPSSPPPTSSPSILTKTVKILKNLFSSIIFRGSVILVTLIFLSFGVWGSLLISQKFDPTLLLPSDSYLRQFLAAHDQLYPNDGWEAEVYTTALDHTDLSRLDKLVTGLERLKREGNFVAEVDPWWTELKRFSEEKTNFTTWQQFANPIDFPIVLSDFLFSIHGSKFRPLFKFSGQLECNRPAPPVLASKFSLTYQLLDGPSEHIPAKSAVDTVIRESGVPGAFSHVQVYAAWETDEIIGFEMWRNVGLAAGAVFLVTLVLLANLPVCLMVLLVVTFTLADLVGFLHFWDITIDIISCINIVLAIGLCVDYSVHIGHAYLVAKGSRQEKTVEALTTIGPAVLNGGLTTLLALLLLGASTSHVFVTFFKVFVLTVLFGLFHGLLLFPVLLSLVGPTSPPSEDITPENPATSTTTSGGSSPVSGHTIPKGHTNMGFSGKGKKTGGLHPVWQEKVVCDRPSDTEL